MISKYDDPFALEVVYVYGGKKVSIMKSFYVRIIDHLWLHYVHSTSNYFEKRLFFSLENKKTNLFLDTILKPNF